MYHDKVDTLLIASIVSSWTGISVDTMLTQTESKVLNLKAYLQTELFGQDDAIKRVSDVILRSKAQLSSSDKPLGSFLFLGATGVGKTALAQLPQGRRIL